LVLKVELLYKSYFKFEFSKLNLELLLLIIYFHIIITKAKYNRKIKTTIFHSKSNLAEILHFLKNEKIIEKSSLK
jgi:hypothetical protein